MDNLQRIDVAIAADDNYVQHAAVVAHSLLVHHPQHRIRLHFLHSGTSAPETLAALRSTVESGGGEFLEVRIPPAIAQRLKPHPHFGTHAWMRMLLPELLGDIDRVLYLDSDVVVHDRLDALWATPLDEQHWIAAVINPLYPHQRPARLSTLGLSGPRDYFNSGVLLMDLARLRAERASEQLLDFADRFTGELVYPDQDVLNAVLKGRWRAVHPRFNAQSPIFDLRPAELPFDPADVRDARKNPAIVHFSGLFKPWMDACGHPLRRLYWSHLEQTPWRGAEPENRYLRNIVLKRLPYRLYYWYWQHFPQPQAQRRLTRH